jgi:alpha-N-arabinofuranosidase
MADSARLNAPRTAAHAASRALQSCRRIRAGAGAGLAVLCALLAVGCGSGAAGGAASGAASGAANGAANGADARSAVVKPPGEFDEFRVTLDAAGRGGPVNRGILGSNVQWVDRGDDLLDAAGALRPGLLKLVVALHPSILRYPGGSQADTYHWRAGVGPLAARGENEHFNARRMQPTILGTQEFLELCEATGAEALLSVNLASGTAEEAAAWVSYVNRTGVVSRRSGRRLPPVRYWELGNEPYLKDEAQRSLWLRPDEFGRRAQAFIVAMRGVDPDILIGLPLTNDQRNGFPATPYPGFTRAVLAQVRAPIDYVSLHDAYLPYGMEHEHTRSELYWGAMAASRSVAADFEDMRTLLHTVRPGTAWPFALTEYNALFTLGRGATDDLVAAPVAALYIADLLGVLAQTPDLALANYWSLSGNWRFGAIRGDGDTRPSYAALALFDELLHGELLASAVDAQRVDTPSVGGSSAVHGLPLVEALATRDGPTLRVLLIHKDDTRRGRGVLDLEGAEARSAEILVLDWPDPWSVDESPNPLVRTRTSIGPGPKFALDLPPHSLALVTITSAATAAKPKRP